jgi:hypothetical protein
VPPKPQPPSSYLDHISKTSIARAIGAMVVAMGLLPSFVDFPVLSRWDGWAMMFVLSAFLVCGSLTSSGRTTWSVAVVAAAAAIGILVFVPLPDLSHKPEGMADQKKPDQKQTKKLKERPRVSLRSIGLDPIATIFAFERRWVLRSAGEVLGMNPDGSGLVSFSVNGPATAIVACAGALVISYGNGYVGRFSPTTHRRLAHYRYGYGPSPVVCGGGYVWLHKPASGTIVQLNARTLKLVIAIPVAEEAMSIAYGMGAIWVVDAVHRTVVGVDERHHQLLGPFAVMADPDQIVVAAGYLWVLHPQQSRLLRVDVHRGWEVGPGIALGSLPSQMRLRNGAIFVTDYGDDTVTEIDVETLRTSRPLRIPDAGRLVDVDERRGSLIVLDQAKGNLLTVDPAAQAALRSDADVRTQGSVRCPS